MKNKKEAYYFSHDSNARQDEKIIALRMKHGWEGYGLYWALIEKLRDESDFSCALDYNMIAFDLRTDPDKIKSIVEDFSLFQFTENGDRFYSESLSNRMEVKAEKSKKAKRAAEKRWSKNKKKTPDNQEVNANALQTHSDSNADPMQLKERKGKEIKGNKKKVKDKKPGKEVSADAKTPPLKYDEIKDFFNSLCDKIPKIRTMTEARKRATKKLVDTHGKEALAQVFRLSAESAFMNGENDRNWVANYDWIVKPANFVKILEGTYRNKGTKSDRKLVEAQNRYLQNRDYSAML